MKSLLINDTYGLQRLNGNLRVSLIQENMSLQPKDTKKKIQVLWTKESSSFRHEYHITDVFHYNFTRKFFIGTGMRKKQG